MYLPGSVPVRYTVAKTDCRAHFSGGHARPDAGVHLTDWLAPGPNVLMSGLAVSMQAVSRWPASAAVCLKSCADVCITRRPAKRQSCPASLSHGPSAPISTFLNVYRARHAAAMDFVLQSPSFQCFVPGLVLSQIKLERWVRCPSKKRRWGPEIGLSLSVIFEARALLTRRFEPRHWISTVSSGMKSSSSPPVSAASFLQVVPQLLHR